MDSTRLLQRSQAFVKLLERSAFIGVWSISPDLQDVIWSEQLALLHGREAGYNPPRGEAFSFYAPEWREKVRALLALCAQDGTPVDAEVQIVKPQGTRSWMRLIGHAVPAPDGTITAVEGALQEIAPHGHAHGTLLRHTVSMGGAMGSGEAFATLDREGRFSYLNEQATLLLSTGGEDLLGRKIWTMFQKTVRLRLEELLRDAFAHASTIEFEEPDAWQSRWLEVRGYPFGGGLAVHLRDVTARRKSQEHLRLLESSISRLNDIVIITEAGPFSEPGPRIVFVNEAFERRTGYARNEVLGRTPRLLQGPGTQRAALDRIRNALEQWQPVRVDVINYNKAGDPYWVDLDISPVWSKERMLTHWVAVGRDVTERKLADKKIKYLAFYDQLTKLPNRQLLMDRLEEALSDNEHPRDGALMFIDLDNFKVLNDTLGHQKGDLLLQQVAARLRSCVARNDTVARLGGDEFVILLQNRPDKPLKPQTGARIVADRILAVLGEPYVLPGCLHHSTCSIGVALFDKSTPWTVSELLKQADVAMYQAKSLGRNTACFFDPQMQASVNAGAALASDLRDACRNNEFVVAYQPQVDGDGNMAGVEALLRWN
ncbi:MAG: diguanylate cyclase, partial [Bdellovibrionales bacterium]|nr:diguanylate cyclase [Ramlibacter sp.]